MPFENIGACGTPASLSADDQEWFIARLEMAILYIRHVCGPPPLGCDVEITHHEHDLGTYSEISLTWEQGTLFEAEWKYLNRCQMALLEFESAMNWYSLDPNRVREKFVEFETRNEEGQI